MRVLSIGLIAFLALASCSPNGQSRNQGSKVQPRQQGTIRIDPVRPFPEAKEVRLFVDTGKTNRDRNVVYARPNGRKLTAGQRNDFERLLRIETPINVPADSDYWLVTSCFIPHHFFRYYDGSGHQIGEISVCFCCAGIEIEPSTSLGLKDRQRFEVDYVKLKSLVSSWGERTDIQCDSQMS